MKCTSLCVFLLVRPLVATITDQCVKIPDRLLSTFGHIWFIIAYYILPLSTLIYYSHAYHCASYGLVLCSYYIHSIRTCSRPLVGSGCGVLIKGCVDWWNYWVNEDQNASIDTINASGDG